MNLNWIEINEGGGNDSSGDDDNVEPQPGSYANSSLLDIVPASVDINVLLDGWWQDYKNNRTHSMVT